MNDIPVGTIKPEIRSSIIHKQLTNTPTTGDSTLVDDPTILVDGTGLVGGPNTTTKEVKSVIKTFKLFTKLPRSS